MARIGHLWGSPNIEWKEWLHPRGPGGRFRTKGGGEPKFVAGLARLLQSFDSRDFQSDGQVSQFLHNTGKPWTDADHRRLLGDLGETNAHLRAGEMDPSTQKFVDMMDRQFVPAEHDLLVNRTVGPEAFGLTPETMGLADGGMADFPGALVADKGYSTTTMGSIVGSGPITMSIAVPKGTKIAPTRTSGNDRGVMLDRGQPLRITKVTPDGRGGFQVMAVAHSEGEAGEVPSPIGGPERSVTTPEAREARVTQSVRRPEQAPPSAPPTEARIVPEGETPERPVTRVDTPGGEPSPQGPTDTGPGGPPPRTEAVVTESLGGGGAPSPQAAPEARAPEAPAQRAADFRQAVQDAGVTAPPQGRTRKQWNDAYQGIVSGKKEPSDALRELEADISHNEGIRDDPDTPLHVKREYDSGIRAQNELADTIASNYNLERKGRPAPAKVAAPEKPVSERGQRIRALRQRALDDLREQGFENPRSEMVEEQMRALKDIDERAEIRRRSGAGDTSPPPAKKVAKKAAASKLSPDQQQAMVDRVDRLRAQAPDFPRNEEEERLQREYDLIKGGGAAPVKKTAPVAKAAPVKKAVPAKKLALKGEFDEKKARADFERIAREAIPGDESQMTKAELLKLPDAEGARPSWTKDRIKQHIADKRAGITPAPAKRAAKKAVPAAKAEAIPSKHPDLDGKTVKELREIAAAEGVNLRNRNYKSQIRGAIEEHREGRTRPEKPSVQDRVAKGLLDRITPEARRGVLAEMTPEERREVNAALKRVEGTGPGVRDLAKDVGGLDETDSFLQYFQDKLDGKSTILKGKDIGRPLTRKEVADDIDDMIDNRFTGLKARADDANKRGDFDEAAALRIRADRWRQVATRMRGTPQEFHADDVAERISRARDLPAIQAELEGLNLAQLRKTATALNMPLPPRGTDVNTNAETLRPHIAATTFSDRARMARPRVSTPAAQKPVTVPDRKSDFDTAWDNANLDIPDSSAGRSIKEIRDDISSGKLTPDEGIRRLETDIAENKLELADIDADIRSSTEPDERELIRARRASLFHDIRQQEKASKFLHQHFQKAPDVTPDEVKEASPEVRTLGEQLRDASPAEVVDLKRQLKEAGYGDIEGDTGEEVFDNALKKIVKDELARRAAKKAAPVKKVAPPKAPDKPLPNKEESPYQRIDARALSEGLDLTDPGDKKMLDTIQEMLDGGDTPIGKNPTPAAVSRYLDQWRRGPAGPATQGAYKSGLNDEPRLAETPEEFAKRKVGIDAEVAELKRRGTEWGKLADRLANTRRQRKRDAVPDVDPKVTRDEKKEIAGVSELTGISTEQLEKKALDKKKAEAPPKQSAQQVAETLKTINDRDEARTLLEGRTKDELKEILKASGFTGGPRGGSKATKSEIINDIVQGTVGVRLESEALRGMSKGMMQTSVGGRPMTRAALEDMDFEQIKRLEDNLGIKRHSLNKNDRIDAILEKWNAPKPEPPTPGGGAPIPSEVDFTNPDLLNNPHAQDILDLLDQGNTPDDIVDIYVEDKFDREIAKNLVDEVIKARDIQRGKPTKKVTSATPSGPDGLDQMPTKSLRDLATEYEISSDVKDRSDLLGELRKQGAVSPDVARRRERLSRLQPIEGGREGGGEKGKLTPLPGGRKETREPPPVPDLTPEEITQRARRGRLQVLQGGGEGGEGTRPALRVAKPGETVPAKKVAKKAPTKETPEEAKMRKSMEVLTRGGHRGSEGPPLRRVSRVTDSRGEIIRRDRPKADEPVYIPNGGADQGRMHLGSVLGQLWTDLYADDREPNSFVNEIARVGDTLGMRGKGDVDTDVIPKLKELEKRASDRVIAKRIQDAIDDLSAPSMEVPDLPADTPEFIREYFRKLVKIAAARKTGWWGMNQREQSLVEEKADIIRKLMRGDITDAQEVSRLERELSKHDFHESTDGAFRIWALNNTLDSSNIEMRRWIRELYSRK